MILGGGAVVEGDDCGGLFGVGVGGEGGGWGLVRFVAWEGVRGGEWHWLDWVRGGGGGVGSGIS